MSELYMVRHGQASFGKENYDVLSRRGIRQSELCAEYFLDQGVEFHTVCSGTLDRQRRSAESFIQVYRDGGISLPVPEIYPGFDEYDSRKIIETQIGEMLAEDPSLKNDLEKLLTDRKSFQRIFERAMLRWVSGTDGMDGLESWNEFRERVAAAFREVLDKNGRGRRALVFASGGSISASVQHATGIPDDETMRLCWQMVNTSVTRFRYDGSRITLSSFNCFPHLEIQKDRELITYR